MNLIQYNEVILVVRESFCGHKTVKWMSDHYNIVYHVGKMISLCWDVALSLLDIPPLSQFLFEVTATMRPSEYFHCKAIIKFYCWFITSKPWAATGYSLFLFICLFCLFALCACVFVCLFALVDLFGRAWSAYVSTPTHREQSTFGVCFN